MFFFWFKNLAGVPKGMLWPCECVDIKEDTMTIFVKSDNAELLRYEKRAEQIDDVEESLLGDMSVLEKYLLESQELMWIRGKRGKHVPVLIPNDVKEALHYLTLPDVRKKGGVRPNSPYLFANSGHGVFRAWDCLKEITIECSADLIHPTRLTSTGYRAYMATIAQCVALESHQIQWVCDHLGHTEDVHKTHYRNTLGGIERIQLGKLLLLQDKNLFANKFQNKRLDEIQFDDIVENIDSTNGIETRPDAALERTDFFSEETRNSASFGTDVEMVQQAKQKGGECVKWTKKELDELSLYAESFLAEMKTPKRKECLQFIEKSKKNCGELHRRAPDVIMKKISALNMKAKKCNH